MSSSADEEQFWDREGMIDPWELKEVVYGVPDAEIVLCDKVPGVARWGMAFEDESRGRLHADNKSHRCSAGLGRWRLDKPRSGMAEGHEEGVNILRRCGLGRFCEMSDGGRVH